MLKDLKPGTNAQMLVLCQAIEEKTTKNGDVYCEMKVSDKTGSVLVKFWNTNKNFLENLIGQVVEITLTAELYNKCPTYVGNAVAAKPDANIMDFVQSAPFSPEKMFEFLYKKADEMREELKKITKTVLEQYKEELLYYPAAQRIHHDVYGGLLYHVYRMAGIGLWVCKAYPTIDKDLFLAGIILHDIGKLKELESSRMGEAEYSKEGQLFGHPYLGMRMVENIAARVKADKETTDQLLHIIAAHHGKPEWGALVQPHTLEAYLVHQLDMIDSRAWIYEKGQEAVDETGFSEKMFGLSSNVYYKKL